ncbi:MAG: MBG domain-containing protein, partial [Planctomycetia bacterium]|nr:MBG domain-containing protein [Planctomycetia bacterium]
MARHNRFWKNWFEGGGTSGKKSSGKGNRRRRLGIEPLEDRRMLSVSVGDYASTAYGTLHSNPSSSYTIYLDFDGYTIDNTVYWKEYEAERPVLDMDGDSTTFSDIELAYIYDTWAYVAECFAMFEVDVTTQDPTTYLESGALQKSGGNDTAYGIRVSIVNDPDWQGVAGIAYVGSFTWSTDVPALIWWQGDALSTGESIVHEVGHTLGLYHASQWTDESTNTAVEYYAGQGNWSPFMGGGHGGVQQWTKGEYPHSVNISQGQSQGLFQDELSVLVSNGFGYKTDDVPDSTVATLNLKDGQATGCIETSGDHDVYTFTLVEETDIHLIVAPHYYNVMLDVGAVLCDANGNVLYDGSTRDSLSASFDVTLAAGTYTLDIYGDSGTYYTNYGSLGNYVISGTLGTTSSLLTVTTLNDVVDATDGVVSLREAIANAQNLDTIFFSSDVFSIGSTITLNSELGALVIDKAIAIDASDYYNAATGTPGITLDANSQSRVLEISGGSYAFPVTLIGLNLTGGNVTGDGGGIFFSNSLKLDRCVVAKCTATGYGGGIGATSDNVFLTVVASQITGNAAGNYRGTNGYGYGGGIGLYGSGCSVTLMNSQLCGNEATFGGGVYTRFSNTTLTFVGSLIAGNRANTYGGIFSAGSAVLANCTIAGNTALASGGVCFGTGTENYLLNSIVTGNYASKDATTADINYHNSSVTATACNSLIGTNNNLVDGGGNRWSVEPLFASFVAPTSVSSTPSWSTWDFSLLATSPAVDAGSADQVFLYFNVTSTSELAARLDLNDNTRLSGSTIDMGALEYLPSVPEVAEFGISCIHTASSTYGTSANLGSITVTNSGKSGTSATVSAYLSTDGTFDVNDTLLSALSTGSVASGSTRNVSVNIDTTSWNAGSYTLFYVLNYEDSNASDNIASTQLTIDKALLTVTVGSTSITYGDSLPSIAPVISGFQNGDSYSSLDRTNFRLTVQNYTSNVGTYAIVASGLNATNYAISYVSGTLTVEKKALTVTVNDACITYGETPNHTVSYAGFVGTDSTEVLTGTLVYSGSGKNAGKYTISATGLNAVNYAISYVSGTLTVEKKALTVTVNDACITYGETPNHTVSYAGFVGTDSTEVLTGTLVYSGSGKNAGKYTISATGLNAVNYAISYVSGTLTVEKKALT